MTALQTSRTALIYVYLIWSRSCLITPKIGKSASSRILSDIPKKQIVMVLGMLVEMLCSP